MKFRLIIICGNSVEMIRIVTSELDKDSITYSSPRFGIIRIERIINYDHPRYFIIRRSTN